MQNYLLRTIALACLSLISITDVFSQWSTTGQLSTPNLTTGGKVGIGVTSPAENLDVHSSASDSYIRVSRTGIGTAGFKINNKTVMSMSTASNGMLNITNADGLMNLSANQITFGGMLSTGVTAGAYNFNGKLWSRELVISEYSTSAAPFALPSGMKFAVNGHSFFNGSVCVGNGTSSSSPGLHIKPIIGSTQASLWLDASEAPNGGQKWLIQSTGSNTPVGSGKLVFARSAPGNPPSMVITSDNKVGIGNENPATSLEIKKWVPTGERNVMLKLSNTYDGNTNALNEPTIIFDNGTGITSSPYGGGGWAVGAQVAANNPIANGSFRIGTYIGTEHTEHFRIQADGKVGIGTRCFPNDAKLAVNGKLYATAITVRLTNANGCFPDYVFSPEYKLRPLEEVEKFVKENSHLPEVPSAAEVEANGIDVAGMDVILLKKVEELTLYTIGMNKKLEEMQKENESLKARIQSLETK